ncbi:NAD(P)/FAD-dependent oxidoreductase [Sulfurovum riftiae]|uniref:Pyridine nucleotide-disulfide oxidoreductase n=1 Tax=Sulfurovum riftiae TaxID=1630136 RepID=A0A151CJL8_9BACT|nr:FAD/NAD(P)-binding oxidoreductase [Sulfurovum riftiae]KYJ87689.1 pyridine nucleotide-disulfide oxidoreductase [Sulfurovum riftiae]
MSKKIESSRIAFDVLNPIEDMSRRDAMKLLGLGGAATMMMGAPTQAEAGPSSDKKVKVVVVGGGAGGIMALVRLYKALPNAELTIIAPNEIHLYQPGQVFMAAGLYTHDDVVGHNKDLIPSGVEWIKDEVANFDPDNNKVITRAGKEVGYDYMVVATGIVYHYEWIKGLTADDIGTNGISSVYLNDLEKGTTKGGEVTWTWFNELKAAAASGKKPTAIYTQPNTPIKCGGAPQKILYLSADHLRKEGLGANYIFATNGGKLFGLKEIAESLGEVQKRYDTITNKFKHNLVAMDVANKVATFERTYEVKGEYDEDLKEYDMITKKEMVDIKYDFIHVVPPMGPPAALAESKLGWQKGSAKGWLEVDQYTLQHRRYPNVFGIGDVCGIPKGKTGGSARHHGPITVGNLVAQINGEPLKEKFDGYTVCPLKTEYGKIIMAEFGYEGYLPTIPFLDPATPRWFWWAFDLYMLKPMYWHLMMKGWM